MKKTLLVALFRPLAIRMILKSEVFDTLKNKKDLRIVILAPFADNKQITDKLTADNVVFRKLDDAALTKVRKQGLLRNFMATVRLFTYKNTKKEMVSRFAMMHEYRVRNLKPDSKFIAKLF
ncbi:hypothetical protein N9E22_04790, partial [Burkholderiales bacterium]|nr:hypothetical protein [Burkholderiales bacterium]